MEIIQSEKCVHWAVGVSKTNINSQWRICISLVECMSKSNKVTQHAVSVSAFVKMVKNYDDDDFMGINTFTTNACQLSVINDKH